MGINKDIKIKKVEEIFKNNKIKIKSSRNECVHVIRIEVETSKKRYNVKCTISNKYVALAMDRGQKYEPDFCFFENVGDFEIYVSNKHLIKDLEIAYENAIDYNMIIDEFESIKKHGCKVREQNIDDEIKHNIEFIDYVLTKIKKEFSKKGK